MSLENFFFKATESVSARSLIKSLGFVRSLISKISEDTLNPQQSIQKMFSFAKGIL